MTRRTENEQMARNTGERHNRNRPQIIYILKLKDRYFKMITINTIKKTGRWRISSEY